MRRGADHELHSALGELRALHAEILDDLDAVARLAERIEQLCLPLPEKAEPEPTQVMAAAGYLHHLYTAVESIHERIVATLDGYSTRGERWHQELLTLAGVPVEGVRPEVICTQTRVRLSRLLRFRHFFRHAYRIDLLWAEVEPLLSDAPSPPPPPSPPRTDRISPASAATCRRRYGHWRSEDHNLSLPVSCDRRPVRRGCSAVTSQ